MGNTSSSGASGNEYEVQASGVGEIQKAAKRNKRLNAANNKHVKPVAPSNADTNKPQLLPQAAKVVRPCDSQIIYNHGRVGIHGIGPEHTNFPCICLEIAEGREVTKQQHEKEYQNGIGLQAPAATGGGGGGGENNSNPVTKPVRQINPATGRCATCGGILDNQNDMSLPSCSWHDATVPLGSLVNSMVMAQKNFSESLRQVQSEDQPLVMLSKMTNFDMATIRALQRVFTKIGDHDGKDNLISVQELCTATGIPLDSLLGKALFRLFDITRSNNINFRTWVLMLSKLSPTASVEDKISFAFNVYDNDGDGFIERPELVAMLRSVIPDLTEPDAVALIESVFAVADKDGDRRIDLDDYRSLVVNSQAFYDAFTIDITTILRQHYNIISADEISARVSKLQERDLRQDERAARDDDGFMARDHDDVKTIDDLDELDL